MRKAATFQLVVLAKEFIHILQQNFPHIQKAHAIKHFFFLLRKR